MEQNIGFNDILTRRGRENIKQNLSLFGEASNEELDSICSLFELENFPRYHYIIKPGDENEKVYYILKGMIRIYTTNGTKDITNQFIHEDQFFAPIYYLFTGNNNPNYYETIEEVFVLSASYRDMELLYSRHHNLERIGRKIVENYYALFLKQYYDLIQLSEKERYENFRTNYHNLQKRIPIQDIASFLGIDIDKLQQLSLSTQQ